MPEVGTAAPDFTLSQQEGVIMKVMSKVDPGANAAGILACPDREAASKSEKRVQDPERGLRVLLFYGSLRVLRGGSFVEGGIGEVDVFGVHLVLAQPQAFAEAYKMDISWF